MSINAALLNRSCGLNTAPLINPVILTMSTFVSVFGTTTAVAVTGANFRSYSTVTFGITTGITVIFVSSTQITFYVPSNYAPGTYPVQIFSGALGSNIVQFTINNAAGYWNLDVTTNTLTNSNAGGVQIQNGLDALKWLTSPTIAGAYLYDYTNSAYPISSSIAQYSTFYATSTSPSSLPPNAYVTQGFAFSPNLTDQDQFYVLMPGYKLIVYLSTDRNTSILTMQNLSPVPISAAPLIQMVGATVVGGGNCNLYKYANGTWNLLPTT